jgi:hypothetical protein
MVRRGHPRPSSRLALGGRSLRGAPVSYLALTILGLRFASRDLIVGALVVVLVVGTSLTGWYMYSRRR